MLTLLRNGCYVSNKRNLGYWAHKGIFGMLRKICCAIP
ncbi:Uncharacterised protein [Vibrio cholerae]|nr:Uncharacterised protein [Vibrio cholerae]